MSTTSDKEILGRTPNYIESGLRWSQVLEVLMTYPGEPEQILLSRYDGVWQVAIFD